LSGKRIVITRALAQSSELYFRLQQRKAMPISLPLVSFAPPDDYAPLDAALRTWRAFDWVLFTSANAVQSVVRRSGASGIFLQQIGNRPQIAVVGPATSAEVTKAGWSVSHVAKTHLGVALAEELAPELTNISVFLPRSNRANPDLPATLRRLGSRVTEVVAYHTCSPAGGSRSYATKVFARKADAALFFSPSAVRNLADLIGKQTLVDLQNKIVFAAIGPVTAAALHEQGIGRVIAAADTTAQSIVYALESHFAKVTPAEKPLAGAKHG
jgi:uroporphyrinogen-III synthase